MRQSGYLVSFAVIFIATAAFTFGPAPAGVAAEPAEGDELEQIEKEAEELRVRIAELNRRLEEMGLEQRYSLELSPQDSLRRLLELVPQYRELHRYELPSPQREHPEGWTPYEYEGGTYYFIPAVTAAPVDE